MKKFLKVVLAAIALCAAVGPRWGFAAQRVAGDQLFNETALAYTKNSSVLNTDQIDNLSLQAVISSYNVVAQSVFDGTKSTASISISSMSALIANQARMSISIVSTSSGATPTAVAGSYLTLQGVTFKEGAGGRYNYSAAFATVTATNLAAAIVASGAFGASVSSNVVTATVTVAGAGGNAYTCLSSTPAALACGATNFTLGQDNALVAINGIAFRQGTNFTASVDSATTAKSLSDAIMADPRLNTIITSTWAATGVVTATASAFGVNAYTLFTSTPAVLKLNGSATNTTDTFLNGLANSISSGTFTKANHGFTNGLDLLYTKTAGTDPENLVANTTYFAIRDTASTFRLATTRALATAATPTSIVVSTFTGAGTFVFTPLVLAGSPAFKLQVSNDNTNWFDLNVTSVTFVSPYTATNQFWDLGTPSYGYLRANYVTGTQGGVALTLTANGRKSGQ